MEFFDHLFRYPAHSSNMPEENLATEITAFLLEKLPPLRALLLATMDIAANEGERAVSTQHLLWSPGNKWHRKIPDIRLFNRDLQAEVFIEVKINSGTTFATSPDGQLISQTRLYEDCLQHAKDQGLLKFGKLATLTRWSPDGTLKSSHALRFRHFVDWIRHTCLGVTDDLRFPQLIGLKWTDFLEDRGWAVPQIAAKHVESIRSMRELLQHLQDLVGRVTTSATSRGWRLVEKGRTSISSFESTTQVIFAAPIHPTDDPQHSLQIGFQFGVQNEQTLLRPMIYFRGWPKPLDAMLPIGRDAWEIVDAWNDQSLKLDNFADQLKATDDSTPIWDEIEELYEAGLDVLVAQRANQVNLSVSQS